MVSTLPFDPFVFFSACFCINAGVCETFKAVVTRKKLKPVVVYGCASVLGRC